MHEASAAEAIVKMTSAEALSRKAARVSRISLVVGEATGYMRESLEFYVAASAKGTIAEGAALDVRPRRLSKRARRARESVTIASGGTAAASSVWVKRMAR